MTGRSRYLLALMVASLILTILLGWQAQDAARSHHATAEQVLRDYAALAADEFVRRTTNQVGYYGYYPLITALAAQSAAADPATAGQDNDVRAQPAASVDFEWRGIDVRAGAGAQRRAVEIRMQ